jgi:hypothetical protein
MFAIDPFNEMFSFWYMKKFVEQELVSTMNAPIPIFENLNENCCMNRAARRGALL